MTETLRSAAEVERHFGPEFLQFFIGLAEASAEKARGYFKNGEYDRTVGATLMRYEVGRGLREAAGTLFTPEEHGFGVQKARNLAVWFEFEGLIIRGYTVPKGKQPIRGKQSPLHRDNHFSNVPPEQPCLFGKPWVANVSLLWSFDKRGNFVGLRAVIGDGWDEDGQLRLALDLELPTTVAEFRANTKDAQFSVEEDDESLLVPVEHALSSDLPADMNRR